MTMHPLLMGRALPRQSLHAPRGGFTLAELLVVIAIIAILSTVTLFAVGRMAREARLSSATNTLVATLDNARTLAIRDNKPVLVVFRPRLAPDGREQFVEVVTAVWTGESYIWPPPPAGPPYRPVIDRFEPAGDIRPRALPVGIKVAAPRYYGGTNADAAWETQAHFPSATAGGGAGDRTGALLGIMFDAKGRVASKNSLSGTGSNQQWVDFNGDGLHRIRGIDYDYTNPNDFPPGAFPLNFEQIANSSLADRGESDEPYVTTAVFLAVFDDDRAREFRTLIWNTNGPYDELIGENGWITQNADRLQFNRYTGVVMR
jgi:prepilin-type N-terminal cleavage/methylation domain-containing protein